MRPGEPTPRKCHWNELLQWAAAPKSDWLHASNLAPVRLVEIASAVGIPYLMIEAALHESSYPRLESGGAPGARSGVGNKRPSRRANLA